MSQFKYFHSLQGDGSHYVAVTDPGTSLAKLGAEHGFRRVFENDPEIGGRYSALSYFGLVPAAIAGVDIGAVLRTAQEAMEACQRDEDNPGLWLGAALGELALRGPRQAHVRRRRPARVVRAVGRAARRGVDRQGGPRHPPDRRRAAGQRLRVRRRPRVPARRGRRRRAGRHAWPSSPRPGHPTFTLEADGAADLGRIFFVSEFATAVAGWALGINPFDQPNVQEAKDNTAARARRRARRRSTPGDADALLAEVAPPRYLAIMGYVPYSDGVEAGAARLRQRVVSKHGPATTFGYGPRFLHSTGQFHKGGPKVGAFLQVVDEPEEDLEVPGEPYTFGTLIRAQADGDLQTLRSHGLDAVRAGKELL